MYLYKWYMTPLGRLINQGYVSVEFCKTTQPLPRPLLKYPASAAAPYRSVHFAPPKWIDPIPNQAFASGIFNIYLGKGCDIWYIYIYVCVLHIIHIYIYIDIHIYLDIYIYILIYGITMDHLHLWYRWTILKLHHPWQHKSSRLGAQEDHPRSSREKRCHSFEVIPYKVLMIFPLYPHYIPIPQKKKRKIKSNPKIVFK